MPSRFKFRVWLDEYKVMSYDVRILSFADGTVFEAGLIYEWKRASELNVMQCTGLYDNDGVEIYEGDIVSIEISNIESPYLAKIEFADCGFCFDPIDREHWIDDWNLVDDGHRFIVIGNIHENADLLTN